MKSCYGLSSLDVSPTRILRDRAIYLAVFSVLFLLAPALFAQSASHVVISEVYGGGGNSGAPWTNDYIELYNPTSTAASLTGWSVQYASATGTTWSKTNLTGSIPAYGFFLIQQASGGAIGNPLPTPDATGTISMSATAGKVALVNTSTALSGANPTDASIIDLVGYGTAANGFEGSGPAPAPSNTKSVERQGRSSSDATKLATGGVDQYAGNGEDSNNNSSDFVQQSTAVPQNSSSEIEGLRVHNTTTDAYFGKIQRAIDQAASGQTLDVAVGTYSETISLTKNLTITSGGVPSIVGDVTVNSSVSITLDAIVSVQGNIIVRSSGVLAPSGSGKISTTGNSSIDQGGTFSVPLEVNSGTTTASGTNSFGGIVTVLGGATLKVPLGGTLYLGDDLNISGTLTGENAASTVNFSGTSLVLNNATVSVPNFVIDDDSGHDIEGTGTFTDCTFKIDQGSYPSLSADLTITGGTIQIVDGSIDIFNSTLTLDGVSLNITSNGQVVDNEGTGDVVTEGSTTIDQGGTFSVPLEINSTGATATKAMGTFSGAVTVKTAAKLNTAGASEDANALIVYNDFTVESSASVGGGKTLTLSGSGCTFTNNGRISAATTVEGGTMGTPTLIAGSGVWDNLTVASESYIQLSDHMTLTSSSVTNNGIIDILDWAFKMSGGEFVNESGQVWSHFDSFECEGDVTLTQNGTFHATLVILSGTTTTSGLFLEPIIVKPPGTLNIPTSETLTARSDVTVEREYPVEPRIMEGGVLTKQRPGLKALTTVQYGTISGGGNLVFDGYAKTFTNNGIVNAATTFEDNDGDVKSIVGDGSGSWKSLTIGAGCSTSVCSGHTFTGAGTPFLVNGSVYLDPTSTIVYGGSSSQTVAPLTYNNLDIANSSSDVAIGGPVTVNGALTISSRNLTTGANTLTLGSFATITETAPYSVLGNLTTARVCSTGVNETFGGMGVEINAAGAWPGTTTVTRVTGTAPTFPPGIPVKRCFDITPATNTGLNATFVYHYFDNELNGNTESGIQLYNSTDVGSTWSAKGGTVNTSLNTITLTGVGQFSRWIAGGTGNPAPTLTSVAPSTVQLGSTATLTLTGTGFTAGLSTPSLDPDFLVNSFTVLSSTQIRVNITVSMTASVGVRSVTVTNAPPGGGTVTLTEAFTLVFPPPSLSSIAPNSASRGQTLNVVLNGRGYYSEATSVDFGSNVSVNSLSVNSTSQMTANVTVAAEATTGPRGVSVINSAPGGGSTTLNNAFTIGNPAPTLASASPATGVRGETVNVILTGTNFVASVSTANFGSGITVNSSIVNSATQMTVNITIPLDAALGARDVSVVNPAPGGGTTALSGAFTVNNPAPTLASITPTSGNRGQTLSVTVTGTNFIPGVTTPAYGSGITVNSVSSFTSTQVTASVTIDIGATPGPRDITVTNAAPGGGTATLSGAFTVNNPSPTLSSVSPTRAGRGSSINVVLTGTNFLEGVSSVSFGSDVTVNSTTITSATQIKVNISIALSAATGARNVSVTNATPGGGTATLTGGFTVDTSPATGIENTLSAIPEEYVLQEAYPNPFNPSTRIRYGLPEQSRVKLEVYNMLGNVVAELVSGERSKGLYEVEWRAENQPSGVYLVRVFSESVETSKRFIASRKVVLVK